jgi:REP element-mobilizing transposase RayT
LRLEAALWITALSKKVLVGPVEARLKELLEKIATQYGFEMLSVEVLPDYVHLFVSAPPKFSVQSSTFVITIVPNVRIDHSSEIWVENPKLVGRISGLMVP